MTPADGRPPRESPEDWLRHARSDLEYARVGPTRETILPEQVCFHAQQAAEKALKAMLLARGVIFPFTHDIEELLEIARGSDIATPDGIAAAAALTPFAVETRYPGWSEEVTKEEMERAVRLAEAVVAWCRERIKET